MYVRLKKLSAANANWQDRMLIALLPDIVGLWVTDEPESGGKAVVKFHPPKCSQRKVALGIVRGNLLYRELEQAFLAPDGKAYIDSATYMEHFR